MAWTLQQNNFDASNTVLFAGFRVPGSVVIAVGIASAGANPSVPSDGSANVYNLIARQDFGGNQASMWYTLNGNASAGTLTFDASVDPAMYAEFTTSVGAVTYNSHHAEQAASFGTGTDATTSGPFVTAVNGSLIFGFSGSGTVAIGTGFTNVSNPFASYRLEYLEQGSAGSVEATFTRSGSGTLAAMGVAIDTAADPVPPITPSLAWIKA